MRLILLRHGESEWNLQNRFTGWKDVALTRKGVEEANFAGNQILSHNFDIKSIHSSLLKRAVDTTKIVADTINFSHKNIKFSWRLNERHYGALQGLNKSETAEKYGEDQVLIWRRSFDISPPLLKDDDKRHPKYNSKFQNISPSDLPVGESLRDVIARLNPFWISFIKYISELNGDHLIVGHSNSLRAIIKILENYSKDEIISVNIPTGVPLVYDLSKDLNVINKEYLIDKKTLLKKKKLIEQQGKVK